MSRLCLVYRQTPEHDRWLPGDRFIRPLVRRLVRGRPRPGGVDRVLLNLCKGLDRLHIPYRVNIPFGELGPNDRVGVLGRGRGCLAGYDRPNPIVAGIGLMTHPSEWPTLCQDYPVVRYLQHSQWAMDVYTPYFGDRCAIWPVGIDTDLWRQEAGQPKLIDFLIYNKVMWDYKRAETSLLHPLLECLRQRRLTFEEVRYGRYTPQQYRDALSRCRAMIFLCEHESQGLAYQEALASGVPVLAWDQGICLDPNRFAWGMSVIPATSVPYFDQRCGLKFSNVKEFPDKLGAFLDGLAKGSFAPRDYILENLTLERCAKQYLDIVETIAT